jgi:signal transduction histidine kinase
MPPSLHTAHDTGFSNYLRTGERRLISRGPVEIPARRRDGSEFPIQLTLAEIQLNGERCFVGIMHDITKRREVDRLKSEFVSVVSHELRTPLTSIRGSLGLINSGVVGSLPEKVRHMIGIAYRNTDRLSHLINDILDMERIEAGRMDYQMKALKLQPLLEEAIEVNIGYAQSQQVRFVLAPSIPDVWINVDGHRFLQVMANLLSNAAKFSQPHTDVEISVSASALGCRVSIRDHGPGVPDDFHDKIFGKFCQANSSDQRSKTGTGLGLTISKAIIEQFGGTIGYDTIVGEGATFFFDLPVTKGTEQADDGFDASHAA